MDAVGPPASRGSVPHGCGLRSSSGGSVQRAEGGSPRSRPAASLRALSDHAVCAVALLWQRYGSRWPGLFTRVVALLRSACSALDDDRSVTFGIDSSTAFSSSVILACGPVFTLLLLRGLGVEQLTRAQVGRRRSRLLRRAGVPVRQAARTAVARERWRSGAALRGLLFRGLYGGRQAADRSSRRRAGHDLCGVVRQRAGSVAQPAAGPASRFVGRAAGDLGRAAGLFVVSAFAGWIVGARFAVRGVCRTAPLICSMPPVAGLVGLSVSGKVTRDQAARRHGRRRSAWRLPIRSARRSGGEVESVGVVDGALPWPIDARAHEGCGILLSNLAPTAGAIRTLGRHRAVAVVRLQPSDRRRLRPGGTQTPTHLCAAGIDKVARDPADDYTDAMALRRREIATQQTDQSLPQSALLDRSCLTAREHRELRRRRTGADRPRRAALIQRRARSRPLYVPLATTEGTLVASYNRGMRLLTECGGVTTTVVKQFMQRSPVSSSTTR